MGPHTLSSQGVHSVPGINLFWVDNDRRKRGPSQVHACVPLKSWHRGQRQEKLEFRSSLGYMVHSRPGAYWNSNIMGLGCSSMVKHMFYLGSVVRTEKIKVRGIHSLPSQERKYFLCNPPSLQYFVRTTETQPGNLHMTYKQIYTNFLPHILYRGKHYKMIAFCLRNIVCGNQIKLWFDYFV